MKNILIALFLALPFIGLCQPSTITPNAFIIPEVECRKQILEYTLDALNRGDYYEFCLFAILNEHLLDDNIKQRFEGSFPESLKMHIERKTAFAPAAVRILLKLKTKRT